MPEESATPDLVGLVRKQIEAANRHDLDAFMSFCHPDGVYDASRHGVGIFEGPAAIRGLIADWWGAFDDLRFQLEDVLDLGSGVTFSVLRHDGRPAGSSAEVQTRQAYVLEWVGELVMRVTVYEDFTEARTAAKRLAEERG